MVFSLLWGAGAAKLQEAPAKQSKPQKAAKPQEPAAKQKAGETQQQAAKGQPAQVSALMLSCAACGVPFKVSQCTSGAGSRFSGPKAKSPA